MFSDLLDHGSLLGDLNLDLKRRRKATVLVEIERVRQEVGGRRSPSSLGTCLRQHPSNA